MNFTQKPVIILGTNHSGTRVLVKILSILGSDGGDYHNQWHENEFFLRIHRELLSGSPDISLGENIFSSQVFKGDPFIPEIGKKIEKKIAEGLSKAYPLHEEKPWHWKCPSSALFINFWMKVYPEAYYVHIVRNPFDVAGSLMKRKQFLTIRSALKFYDAMEQRIARVNDGNHKYIRLKYETLDVELLRLLDFLPFLDESALCNAKSIIKRRGVNWNREYSFMRNLWIMSVALHINFAKIIRRIKELFMRRCHELSKNR